MDGQIKVVGANKVFKHWFDLETSGNISYNYHKIYTVNTPSGNFNFEISNFVILDNFLEFEGWAVNDQLQGGRLAIQFSPQISVNT